MKSTEALDETLAAIDRHNGELNSFVHLDADLARAAAERVDEMVARGVDPGPLAGVPFGVKDLDDCEGMPTSQGSLWFKGGPPADADAIHVSRFRAAGAVPVGKTAVPEFGTWAYTATKAWGVTRNPWDLTRTPGGSSGGSASAVAAGMVPFATASDGGGSTRTPAGFCGLVGHKPSFGRIPHPGSSAVAQLGVLGAARDHSCRRGAAARPRCQVRIVATDDRCRHRRSGTPTRSSPWTCAGCGSRGRSTSASRSSIPRSRRSRDRRPRCSSALATFASSMPRSRSPTRSTSTRSSATSTPGSIFLAASGPSAPTSSTRS